MSTNYIAPIWRMPRNANKDKLSNYSINLANANERISLTDGVDLGINSTVSLWVNFSTNNNSVILADDVNPSSSGYFLLLNTSTGDVYVRIGSSFGGTAFNTSWNLNQWYNIIIVRQGDTVELFKDNVSLGTRSGYGTTNTTKFDCIGAKNDQTFPMYGQMSQVVGFDYALSTNQRDYIYNLNNPMAITGAEPVAYWPLGDNSNPNAPGSFPNISVGADSVFDFDGSNDFIDLGTEPIVTGEFSISMWIKRSSTSVGDTIQTLIGKDNQSSARVFNIYFKNITGQISFWVSSTGTYSVAYRVDTSTVINDTNWHNIVFLNKGNGQLNEIYIDGAEANYAVQGQGRSTLFNTTAIKTSIGADASTGTTYNFNGQISNVQLWNTELSGSEITTLYNNGQPLMTGAQPQEANLKAWYKLNQSANYDQGIGPFKIEKVGSPDYSVSNNGCFTTGGVLRWQDTNNQVLSDGDYFTYYSPLIFCDSSDVDLITTGGSYQTGISSGLEYSLEYSVDGGSWVVWKAQTVATNQSLQNWTVSNVNNLNCNYSIQVRLRAVGGLFGTEQFNFNDVRINVSGVQTYFETFATAGLGWDNNSYTAPTDNYVDPSWQIPDAVSAYPQSFDFNGKDSYINGSSYTLDGDFSVSVWAKTSTFTTVYGMIFAVGNPSYLAFEKANRRFLWDDSTSGVYRSSNNVWEYDEWVHLVLVKSGTTLQYYINGQADTLTGTSTATTSGQLTLGRWLGNSGNRLIGNLSNFQLWDTALSATQAETLYNNGTPLTTAIATDNLKVWYKLDDNDIWNSVLNQWEIIDYAN
jgi:hypothetical protein